MLKRNARQIRISISSPIKGNVSSNGVLYFNIADFHRSHHLVQRESTVLLFQFGRNYSDPGEGLTSNAASAEPVGSLMKSLSSAPHHRTKSAQTFGFSPLEFRPER